MTWTPQASTTSNPNGNNTVITLTTPVSARYVRVAPTAFSDSTYWNITTVRAFGPTGALAGDTNLSIIADGGLSASQSLTAFGGSGVAGGNVLLSPATEPSGGAVIYFLKDAGGFKVDLGQTFKVDRGALSLTNFLASGAQPLTLTLSGSTDDSTYSTLYTRTYTSDMSGNFDLFNFTFDSGATDTRYLKYTFSTANTSNTNINVTDFAFYQVPEPSTVALGAIGLAGVFYRLRRKQRNA